VKAFLTQYRFNPEAMLDYLELGDEEELHLTPNPIPRGENEVIMEIEEMADILTLSTLTEPDEEREYMLSKPSLPAPPLQRGIYTPSRLTPTSRGHQYHPRKTRHKEPLRSDHDPTNFPISMLSSLLQPCTNFSKFLPFSKKVHSKFKITKRFV
jgi:hypothetical protein